MKNPASFTISTPGRICLFGEHQDYLGLPIIAAAINLRIRISGKQRQDLHVYIKLPDIGEEVTFFAKQRLAYELERDYFRSGFNVLWDKGIRLQHGWDCDVRGEIPINSGTSSSSAMMVSWIKFLLTAANHEKADDPDFVARMAHRAEVLEFNEPGGMMDQFSTSFGDVIYLDFSNNAVKTLKPNLDTFVLGDSQQPKDTKKILANTKNVALDAVRMISEIHSPFDFRTTEIEAIRDDLKKLPQRHADVLRANLIDRNLLQEGFLLLQNEQMDHEKFGKLLTKHHEQLSRYKQVSTEKIDRMLDAAIGAGAYGGKINGSGGGGCMFAYAPENPEAIAEAIRFAGGVPYVVQVDEGARIEE
ncbi:MAG: galactokinase family protein [bacterium]